jgi:ABC-type multidrug transport system fused ATPase/permease subunit
MTSVERVIEYSTIEGENLKSGRIKTGNDWPYDGKIVFDNVSYSYDDNLPSVLNNITVTVNAREKIGIVGRTGSGKRYL